MALGDGSAWDETLPDNDTYVYLGDDHIVDLRKGVRSRMALEHEWPASQASTAVAGQHKFITLQNQTTKPALSGTQLAAIYVKTVATTSNALFFQNSAGTEIQISNSAGDSIRWIKPQVITCLDTTGNYTVSASGWSTMANSSLVFTNTEPNRYYVTVQLFTRMPSAGHACGFDLKIDGTQQGDSTWGLCWHGGHYWEANGNGLSFNYLTPTLTVSAHTIVLMGTDPNSNTLPANGTQPIRIYAVAVGTA